jgi:VWFA-related protein
MRPTRLAAIVFAAAFLAWAAWTALTPRVLAAPPQQETPGPMRPPGAPAAPPQAKAPPREQIPESGHTLKTQTNLVDIFVTARGKHNDIISDLTKNDFKVYEDGQEQKVAYFDLEKNLPLTLGILVDTSGSMQRVLGAEQDTASRFVRDIMRKGDEAMVMGFDFDINLLADFTEDPSILIEAIRGTRINAAAAGGGPTPSTLPVGQNGGTDLYDAVYLACHDELANQSGRKAIILLTDAEDTGSKLSLDDAIEAAQRTNTVIHVLRIADEPFYFGMGIGYTGESVARRMAAETGGREIEIRSEKYLDKAFDEITEELRSQYVLGYYPTNARHDGTFRQIKIDTDRPGVHLLFRKGYYAPSQ